MHAIHTRLFSSGMALTAAFLGNTTLADGTDLDYGLGTRQGHLSRVKQERSRAVLNQEEATSMSEVEHLIAEVKAARRRVLEAARGLSPEQGAFKPAPERWSVAEILEHLVLAEHVGINFVWRAVDGFRRGESFWGGPSSNRGRTIEQIIERTWKPKERAPAGATPRLGGPVLYWVAALEACQPVLERLGKELETVALSEVIYPHFLSGPLDARQRLDFLRFHLDRHLKQIEALKEDAAFPA